MRVCNKCHWQFGHSIQCPSCGCNYTSDSEKNEADQSAWLELRHKQDRVNAIEESKRDKCCWTATHTRGFHHDSSCKNWVTGF